MTNLLAPTQEPTSELPFPPASLREVIRLSGLRMWVEQSDKQVKHALGWSEYQVRSDKAIRRHWQLVCCAFSFCWYHASHSCATPTQEPQETSEPQGAPQTSVPASAVGTGKKNQRGKQATAPRLLAHGEALGPRMARTLDHAAALVASVVRTAPTSCRATAPEVA